MPINNSKSNIERLADRAGQADNVSKSLDTHQGNYDDLEVPDIGLPALDDFNVLKSRELHPIYRALNKLEEEVDFLISSEDSVICTWGPIVNSMKDVKQTGIGKIFAKLPTDKINWNSVKDLIDGSADNLNKAAGVVAQDLKKMDEYLTKKQIKDVDVINRFENIIKKYLQFMKGSTTPGFVRYIGIFSGLINKEE